MGFDGVWGKVVWGNLTDGRFRSAWGDSWDGGQVALQWMGYCLVVAGARMGGLDFG